MHYLIIGVVVACGAMIQGAIGFAFGIFSIPLLVFVGMPLEEAITFILALVLVQTVSSFWQNKTPIPWREVIAISVPRFITVFLGVYLLDVVRQQWTPGGIKQMIGVCLLTVVGLQLWFRPAPRESLGAGWTWLAGIVSGIMAGLIGMGGTAVVLWTVAHEWTSHKSRALMWCTFSLMVPWQLMIAYQRFGMPVLESAGLGLAYIPVVVVATIAGTRIGNRISQDHLRKIAYTVLTCVGLLSIVTPML